MIAQHRTKVTREISKVSWILTLILVINVYRHIWKLEIEMLHTFQKHPQNEQFECIKEYVHDVIIDEVKEQYIGPKFSTQADEFAGISNSEHLGLLPQYVNNVKGMNKTKIKVFCEMRWIEKHVVLEEVQTLCDFLLITLGKITNEAGWDCKTIDVARGLMRNITESTFVLSH